ncbi:GIY-YIG nuclease family protein [Candidatus Roizmanbacteria bacterium]|nr:GIY-YIG nuclease family protein [Candidatus Roizmanbacteria bacterium]
METSDVSVASYATDIAKYKSSIKERFYVYIFYSLKDHGLYIGFSPNLKVRLIKHAKGQVISTKLRRPLQLIHYEYSINKADAKAREEFLKSGFERQQLKEALKRTLKKV